MPLSPCAREIKGKQESLTVRTRCLALTSVSTVIVPVPCEGDTRRRQFAANVTGPGGDYSTALTPYIETAGLGLDDLLLPDDGSSAERYSSRWRPQPGYLNGEESTVYRVAQRLDAGKGVKSFSFLPAARTENWGTAGEGFYNVV